MTAVGKSKKRIDAAGKVTGRTVFASDIRTDGMLAAVPLVSSIPFGRILRIHHPFTENTPGFAGLFLAEDIPGKNQVGVIVNDQPLLTEDIVRYVGDSIGILVAESHAAACALVRDIQIEYEEFEPVFSIEDGRDAAESVIHPSHIACEHRVQRGDIAAAFAKCHAVFETDFTTPYQEHYYLEPQSCTVIPRSDGSIFISGSLQCPFYVQKAVASVLGLPLSRVVVEQAPTGGAFGGKEDIPSEVCARTALAATLLNRPVQMTYTRETDVQLTSKRHPFEMHYKVGVSRDGKILAADINLEENSGAYATLSSVVSYRAAMQAMGPYSVPNIQVLSRAYYTNLPPAGAFRGFGSPQVTFGHERMMEIIADGLKMDPFELRMRNILRPGSKTQTGQLLHSSVGAAQCLEAVRDLAQPDPSRSNDRYLTGAGLAVSHYGNCLGAAGWFMDGAGARIKLNRDASVNIGFGLVEMGQGALTVTAQMASDALGISSSRITVDPTSTSNVPDSGPSVASRNVVMTGNAILEAADQLKSIIFNAAGEMTAGDPQQFSLNDDRIKNRQSGKEIRFDDLCEFMYQKNYQMDVIGWWHVPRLEYDPETGTGDAYFTYSYSAHAAAVQIDTLTGIVTVTDIRAAHDVGRVINPAGLEGQVEGGAAQGIGWALTENFKLERGHAETANLATYLIPTALDTPRIETIPVEEPNPDGPWGAKGVGEPAIIPTGAAIANAVSRAVGNQFNQLPITPESVLKSLSSGNGS